MRKTYECPTCQNTFLRYESTVREGHTPFCSRSCASKSLIGDKNPNFGKAWNKEQRETLGKKVSKNMEIASIRHSVGNANRGKKFDDARINKMHAHRPPSSYGHPQSEERKIQIGKESSERWKDPIFRKCVIEKGSATKEAKGLIVPRKYLTSWKFYWREANWISGFIYCKEKNLHLKGLCRDHIVGRKQGFLLGIFPEILRHPLNCQVITLSENSKKARNTADEKQPDILIEKILNYMGNYPQHEHAKFLAEEYLKGKRWKHEQNLV